LNLEKHLRKKFTLPSPRNRMDKKKILLLEDEVLIAKMYTLLFEQAGYDVNVLNSANNIIALVQILAPDFIVMDNQLKNKQSGFEAAHLLRQAGIQTPIMFTTGNAENITREVVSQVANSSYQIKPIDVKKLLSTIQRSMQDNK
jgi:CheY-like chemotaxis protein